MSPSALARKAGMLPELLVAVRWRRRRRVAGRAAAALAVLVLGFALWPDRAPIPGAGGDVHDPGASERLVCERVRTDVDRVATWRQRASAPREWFVGDDELQAFLRAAERPEGIVRVRGRATVASAAVDPLPTSE